MGRWRVAGGVRTFTENVLSAFLMKIVYIGGVGETISHKHMKKFLITTLLAGVCATLSLNAVAADKKDKKDEKKSAYPLKTCVVSDEKLGEMGKPYVMKYKGREVQLCCSSCEKDFKKDPDKYLKKLDEAEKKSK
jgi:YHS domain-containing protein